MYYRCGGWGVMEAYTICHPLLLLLLLALCCQCVPSYDVPPAGPFYGSRRLPEPPPTAYPSSQTSQEPSYDRKPRTVVPSYDRILDFLI